MQSSRLPLPTTSSPQSFRPQSPTTSSLSNSNSNTNNGSPASRNSRRPESIYSASSLNQSLGPGSYRTGEELAETRKKQGKKDEAIRRKIEASLALKRPTKRVPPSQQQQQQQSSRRPKQGTVSALRPLPALTVPSSISVSDASQLCAAKRTDCVLVVDEHEHLCGIFTAKDLAFRVVGDGLDPRTTPVSAIMTPNPMVTRDSTSATEALQTMVTKGFRHLPVCNEDGDVVGLLDITKVFHECLEKLEKAHGASRQLYSAAEAHSSQFSSGGAGEAMNPLMAYVQALREKMSFPDLGSILDARTAPATVGVKTTVLQAARLMRERRTTAVCVMEADGKKIAGIFTSKDVVLRVIAAGLDSRTCSVVRVMTPHPDTGTPQLSIQDALRKMHDGHYLNLPVVDDSGSLVGIVDVLKLTYATLEQVNSMEGGDSTSDKSGGPLWGRFFNALGGAEDDTESVFSNNDPEESQLGSEMMSPTKRQHGSFETTAGGSEVSPNDSASVVYEEREMSELGRRGTVAASSVGMAVPPPDVDDGTYLFKFVAPGGTTHRFQARYDSFEFITDIVGGKLASDPFFAPSSHLPTPLPLSPTSEAFPPLSSSLPTPAASPLLTQTQAATTPIVDPKDFKLSYTDDDGDLVLMTADRDVMDAVSSARKQGKDRVVVQLTGGASWEIELERRRVAKLKTTVVVVEEVAPVIQSQKKGLKRVEESEEEEEEEEEAVTIKKKKSSKVPATAPMEEELVFGFLKKEQLLPASVAFLAITIVGVFAIGRATAK